MRIDIEEAAGMELGVVAMAEVYLSGKIPKEQLRLCYLHVTIPLSSPALVSTEPLPTLGSTAIILIKN